MFQRKYVVAFLMALSVSLMPILAFADGGHGENEGGSAAIGPIPLSIGIALVAVAILYVVPSIKASIVQYSIVGLGAITAVIHLMEGIEGDTLLLLNALGYIALLILFFIPVAAVSQRRFHIWVVLLVYTLTTFVAYFLLHSIGEYGILALFTKVVEAGLAIALIADFSQERAAPIPQTMAQ